MTAGSIIHARDGPLVRHLLAGVCLLALGACSPGLQITPATPALTSTGSRPATPGPSPTPLPTTEGVPTSAPASGVAEACPTEDDQPPNYSLRLRLDYPAHRASVKASVQVSNRTGQPLTDLAFGMASNLYPDAVEWQSARVDQAPVEPILAGPWIKLPLAATLGVGCEVEAAFDYQLNLPRIDGAGWAWQDAFGWTPQQTLLAEWYPVLTTHDPESGWRTWAVPAVGEFQPAEASHVLVEVDLAPGSESVAVFGGSVAARCNSAWCFEADGVRSFALAASDRMEMRAVEVNGATIVSAFYPEHAEQGAAVLDVASRAYRVYGERFGAIAGSAFTVVEADLVDGMEYSGLAFVGRGYYAEYDGTPKNYLTLIVAHETAHQWWYGSVGSDPAAEPWLDEALATYSERVVLQDVDPALAEWWMDYRLGAYAPSGNVGSTVYDHAGFRPYVNAVYLRGAQMLAEIHGRLGDERFFDFLQEYHRRFASREASGADFWEVLGGYVDTAQFMEVYFAK